MELICPRWSSSFACSQIVANTPKGTRPEPFGAASARSRLARPWNEPTARLISDAFADMLYTNADNDRATVEAVAGAAAAGGVTRAQIGLAWLRRNPSHCRASRRGQQHHPDR